MRILLTLLLLFSANVSRAATWLEDEAETQTNLAFEVSAAQNGSLNLLFSARDERNAYRLECSANRIALSCLVNGKSQLLTSAPHAWKANSRVTVQRRSWTIRAIVDNRVLLTAFDATFEGGKIAPQTVGAWKAGEVRVQPVEEVYFSDDFTRAENENGEWKTAASSAKAWQLTATSDDISKSNSAMSANPFGYLAQSPNGLAWSQSGRWFWDNYEAQVSARPSGNGAIGLAVYVQDARNYLAFRWSGRESASARRLVRVVDGRETVLAQSGGAWLNQTWYRIGVRTSPGYVEAFIDGAPIFRVRDNSFGQGAVALLAQNTPRVAFDDVRVRSYGFFRPDFGDDKDARGWQKVGGGWRAQNGVMSSQSPTSEKGKTRFLLTGKNDWHGYSTVASVQTGARGAGGVVVGFRDERNYTVFRWAGPQSALPFRGRRQLLRYLGGKATVLSDEALGELIGRDGWARISIRLSRGALAVGANDQLIAQWADDKVKEGKTGLWTQGTAAVGFRDVTIFFAPEAEAPRVPPKMEADALMVGWASPTGEWPPRRVGGELQFWNTGEFFGDATIEFDWLRDVYARGTAEIALRASDNDFRSGLLLRLSSNEAKTELRAELLRGQTLLRSATIAFSTLPPSMNNLVPVRAALEGAGVLVTIGETSLLSYVGGKDAPHGTRLAARAENFALSGRALRATSTSRDDYTFSEAPTDWYSPSGQWSVISRWPCFSDWSFFGGIGLNPVLWNKRVTSGDTVVEMYAHNQMDLPKELGYSNPGNLNVTLCGDGISPASGYAFVLAGWSNTQSRLMKNGKVLAQNASDKARFDRASNANLSFHKRWYYVRAEARREVRNGVSGVHLKLSVDEEIVLEAFDAQPLPAFSRGGRSAFWTVDGTMMIARAKIESQHMGLKYLPSELGTNVRMSADSAVNPTTKIEEDKNQLTPRPLTFEGEIGASVVRVASQTPNKATWRIVNTTPGGSFGASWTNGARSLAVDADARLEGALQIAPGSKIDFYACIDGQRYLLAVGDNAAPDADTPTLGRIELTPQDDAPGWSRFSFALGKVLKERFPEQKQWTLEAIESGALHGDEYRWSGFDGNALGATYSVRNLRLID